MYLMILLFTLLGGFLVPGVRHVGGIFIYTASEVEAVNGTDVKLKCIFSSRYPVSLETVTVTWYFKPLRRRRENAVFFYLKKPYPVLTGRFKKRVVWSGDVMNKDASITLKRVSPKFNGTYSCQVRNRPDFPGRNGEVVLRVVNKAPNFNPLDLLTALLDMF